MHGVRRSWIATALLASLGLTLLVGGSWYAAGDAAPRFVPDAAVQAVASPTIPGGVPAQVVGLAEAPAWYFAVIAFEDPYTGTITRPQTPESGTRYVAAEVLLSNASDQPLNFKVSDVILRDLSGVEYRSSGQVQGDRPRLATQTLPQGDWTRGWVWFAIPEDAQPKDLSLVGPTPQFRVDLPSDAGE